MTAIPTEGPLCCRCNNTRTLYQLNWKAEDCYVCPACMTEEERARFETLNQPEFHV